MPWLLALSLLALPGWAFAVGSTDRYTYDAAGNIIAIKNVAADALTFTSFSPGEAPFTAPVTLSGTGFSPVAAENLVSFNGTPAVVLSASTTSLVVAVPTNARSGRISISVGGAIVTNPTIFIVDTSAEAPTIASFSPLIAAAGDTVTLTGTNYDPVAANDVLVINSTDMAIGTVNTTQMSTTIPPALASGKISVTTIYGTATSATDLIIAPPGAAAADIGSSLRTAVDATPVSFSIPAGKIGMVLFEGSKGQNVALGVTSLVTTPANGAMSVSLIAPNGADLTDCKNQAAPSFSCHLATLPSFGTYTLVFTPASSAGATFTMTLSSDIVSALTPSTTASSLSFPRAAQTQRLTFNVAQGAAFTLELAGIALSSPDATLTATVIHPAGFALLHETNSGAGGMVVHVPNVTFSGTYTVLVEPNNGATGSAQLTLDAGIPLSINGPPVNIATTAAGKAVSLTFEATAGQSLGLVLTGLALDPASFQFVGLALYNPDGTANDSLNAYPYCQTSSTAGCRGYLSDLPLSGTYTLLILPGATISAIAQTEASKITTTVTLSSDIQQNLTPNTPAAVNFTRIGQNARLSFAATAGVPITLDVSGIATTPTGPGYGITASILDPSGALVQQGTANAGGIVLDVPAPTVTGTYTLLLQLGGSATGSMQVLLDTGTALAVDGAALNIATTSTGQAVKLNFTATAGQTMGLALTALSLSNASSQYVSLILLNPDGSGNAFSSYPYCSTSSTAGCNWNIVAPQNGTYTLFVLPAQTQSLPATTDPSLTSGTVTLSTDVSATLTLGTPVTLNLTRRGQKAQLNFSATAGQPIAIEVSGVQTVPAASGITGTMLSPSGAVVQQATSTNGTDGLLFYLPSASVTGTFTLIVQPASGATCTAQVTLDGGTNLPSDGTPVSIAGLGTGQAAMLHFTESAGQTLGLHLTGLSLTPPITTSVGLIVYNPDGSNSTFNSYPYCFAGGGCSWSLSSLSTAGTYTLFVIPGGQISTPTNVDGASVNATLNLTSP